jgi:hypothetical protein
MNLIHLSNPQKAQKQKRYFMYPANTTGPTMENFTLNGHGLDFVSDAKPEKEIARAMMRMTLGINKKYFKIKHPLIGNAGFTVSCTTCHKGQAFPDGTDQK